MRMRNEKTRVTGHCSVKHCPWRIHASPLADGVTFQIKTYVPNHTCVRSDATKEASVEWIAGKIENVLRENPGMKPRGIKNELKKYGVNPQYMQIYRARKKAMGSIEGCHAESFGRLPYYAKIVLANNERSVVTLQCDVDESESIPHAPFFETFFLGLSALRDGFLEGCSPFLGFDGCHLKVPFGGVLLAAIGLDGNNGLFPVAFAIAESECKESWEFFFENLSIMLSGFSYDKPWTFMRDRQKGLVETINEIVPNAVNRRCARHIYANFRGQFAGAALKRYFWQAARSYNVAGFNFALHKIKELKPVAYDWLLNIPAEMWSRHAFDERLKNDHVTNNISESFNHWVEDRRSKPMLTLVDGLRTKLMCRLQKRKLKGLKMSGDLVPNVERLFGVFCDSRFSKENYIKAYSYCIHPVPDPTFWPQDLEVEPTNLLPPIVRRMPGRPKKNRRNEPGEAPNVVRRSNMVRCKVFNDLEHNKRTCPYKGKDLELDVPLAQLASRKRKTEGSSSQFVAPTKTKKKTKAKSLSQPVPKPPISSSQPLPNTKHDISMHVAGSTSQPPSNSGAAYLPPSFWRGLGVSPQREIRSKNNQDAKEVNPYEACKQQ
ncbi:hypothetical protein Sango_1867300 [Sesamum angolense]|uniref:MULE transposase domain-containing protein n=1 Tax=Sesamum angolense TaxID=2727404 RepID=A0AAE2BQP2_9LAMI|nr:hypothetical protein Sango_1867300 [Sesamum angolense]